MKKIFKPVIKFCFFMLSFNLAEAQETLKILKYIKEKKIDRVVENCSLPFEFYLLDDTFDGKINTKYILKKRFVQLITKDLFFDTLFTKGKIIYKSNEKINYQFRTFNIKGELESESNIIFYFVKSKGKTYLKKILLAG